MYIYTYYGYVYVYVYVYTCIHEYIYLGPPFGCQKTQPKKRSGFGVFFGGGSDFRPSD